MYQLAWDGGSTIFKLHLVQLAVVAIVPSQDMVFFAMQEKVCITQAASDSDTGKGKSKMSKQIKHGYHLVEGKSGHAMEDYVFAEFRQVDENELGLFAIFDGHLSREIPNYLKSHLFNNILKEKNSDICSILEFRIQIGFRSPASLWHYIGRILI